MDTPEAIEAERQACNARAQHYEQLARRLFEQASSNGGKHRASLRETATGHAAHARRLREQARRCGKALVALYREYA